MLEDLAVRQNKKTSRICKECSDGARGPEPAVSPGMAVVWEVTSLLWPQRRRAGLVLRAAGSVFGTLQGVVVCVCIVPAVGQ